MEAEIFHGTLLDYGKEIVRTKAFVPTDERGRYGAGIYFYDSDPLSGLIAAKDWAEHAPGRPTIGPPAVVAVQFKSARVFDMTAAENAPYINRLTLLFTQFIERTKPDQLHQINEQLIGKLIGTCAPECHTIQAIRGLYKLPTIVARRQKGLVIRDESCIFNPRLIENFA